MTNSKTKLVFDTNPLEKSFATMECHQVDIAIVCALAANRIAYNVLRNPDFQIMVKVINNASKCYKALSFDRHEPL